MKMDPDQVTPRATVFNESLEFKRRKEFSNREVGITHPDNSGFMRISDSGEIEIFAAPGVGLIINPNTRSVSIYADSIKLFSREDDGLRWNEKSFNPASDVYNEPTFLKTNDFMNNPAYYRSNYYLDNLQSLDQRQEQNPITITGSYGLGIDQIKAESYTRESLKLTEEQKNLVANYARGNSQENTDLLVELISAGYTFQNAIEKIQENDKNMSETNEKFPEIYNDLDR